MTRDFYYIVRKAKENHTELSLLKRWHGHPKINLGISPRPVFITKHATYRSSKHRRNSIEDIFESASLTNREIPFACLIHLETQIIVETIRGSAGTWDLCDWEKGALLKKAFVKAKESGLKVVLGHTHPTNYGPVCSNVHRPEDGPFGGDFTEMWKMIIRNALVSKFNMILTPNKGLVGVFELKNGGRVIYHPFKILPD